MKIRAIILVLLVSSGAFMMIQSMTNEAEQPFSSVFSVQPAMYQALIFHKPSLSGRHAKTWIVDETSEVEAFLQFLDHYHIRKLQPEHINLEDEIDLFSIQLIHPKGTNVKIFISEQLIIQNANLYYEVVNEPVDIDWLVQFFIDNRL